MLTRAPGSDPVEQPVAGEVTLDQTLPSAEHAGNSYEIFRLQERQCQKR